VIGHVLAWLRSRADRDAPPHIRDGRRGEELAYQFLRRRGYTIVARGFRPRTGKGEIDLIGWDGEKLAFIEVKTRGTADFGEPERAIGRDKRAQIIFAAEEYARRAGAEYGRIRYDTVSVILREPPEIALRKDAFSARSEQRLCGLQAGAARYPDDSEPL
jgi:putative endonuclease